MVGKVIRDYMEGGAKKLTVPGFGTFMRRDGGEVIFVDLLRGDDHILSEMVEDRGGYSEIEAMAVIDRFIFETKNAIESRGNASIAGFGTMTLDHKGVYQFDYSPGARPVKKETAVQESLFETGSAKPAAKTGGKSQAAQANRPEPVVPSQRNKPLQRPPARKSGRKPRAKKLSPTDTILIVAIAAAAVALIALVFGMSSGNVPFLSN